MMARTVEPTYGAFEHERQRNENVPLSVNSFGVNTNKDGLP